MPAPYTGNPSAAQAPSPAPSATAAPIVLLPVGGDRGAIVWEQPLKVLADWVAFLVSQAPNPPIGKLLRVSVLTTGTSLASFSGCRRAVVRMVGGGGGGAGGGGVGAGGGGSGGYAEFSTTTVPVNWTYAIGAAGAAGTSAPTAGGSGGNTTFSDGVTTVTAFGGGGGGTSGQPGLAPATSTNGTINVGGEAGGAPLGASLGGRGGCSRLGGAGGRITGLSGTEVGKAGTGPGAGGSGGYGTVAGGAGTAGMIVLEEYG